ncbi:MAG: lipoyl(octanoyl) transferase LipB [Planctomycetota bacterium]|jgi:lipoate-protein ligase B
MTDLGSPSETSVDLVVRDLGRVPYAEALALQRDLQREVLEGRRSPETRSMYLLLVEHDPAVITVTRRRGARQHLVATEQELRAAGVEVAETDRGGDITYHGPGQLVAYPILDLNVLRLRLHSYMRFLEQVVIDTLAPFGLQGRRDPGATGVWTDAGKICALGVRVSRWVSMHGLALNVTTNLDHFELIVPCGLAGRVVTSLGAQLGDGCPGLDEVKRVFVEVFRDAVARQ